MITLSEFSGRKAAVFGLGIAGEAAVASFVAGKAKLYAWDDSEETRSKVEKRFGSKINLVPPAQWPWDDLACLCLSPGIPLTHPAPHPVVRLANQHKCPIIGEVELLYRACPQARFIGITGTNGKSTTTSLIGHILHYAGCKVEVGGNLGTPALALEPLEEGGIYVLELSSYQLDLVQSTRFNISVFLNLSPDHLDRHGDMDHYIAAKERIFDRMTPEDTAVIGLDDAETRKVAKDCDARPNAPEVITVSSSGQDADVTVSGGVLRDATDTSFSIDISEDVSLTGQHNWQNAAAAYAVARACHIVPDIISRALDSFEGLPHRLQLVAGHGNVRFFNDSKATNADATARALEPFEYIHWIVGGKPKSGGIAPLERYFPRIAHAYLIGEAEKEFAATLEGKVPYTCCGTLQEATRLAAAKALAENMPGSVVLLSPACASFDQFKNFEERGECFVRELRNVELTHAA